MASQKIKVSVSDRLKEELRDYSDSSLGKWFNSANLSDTELASIDIEDIEGLLDRGLRRVAELITELGRVSEFKIQEGGLTAEDVERIIEAKIGGIIDAKLEPVVKMAAEAKAEAGHALKRSGEAKEEADHALRRTGSGDCLIGAVMDLEVREEADRRLRTEAGVEFGPYVVKNLRVGIQIINQVYDEFIEKYEKEGNSTKANALRNERLTTIKVDEISAVEMLNNDKYAGRINIVVSLDNGQHHVLQVIGYDPAAKSVHYAEDNGEGHSTGYGKIDLDETRVNSGYVFCFA